MITVKTIYKCFVPHRSVVSIAAALLLFTGCKNDYDFVGSGTGQTKETSDAVAFSAYVSSSRQASRANATIVNKGVTSLLPTATSNRRVGIFGCYTGKYTWAELVKLSNTAYADRDGLAEVFADLKAAENGTAYNTKKADILNKYYSANLMFNTPATINANGTLSYLPLQFWSNNQLPGGTEHEYMTFWAYYPFNESSTLGEFGISMTNDEEGIGQGKGMGKVKFTMHADAANHNDFLISAPVTDCNRDKYMLQRTDNTPSDDTPSYDPKPVQFRLYHMLAQVRFYTYIRGDDKMVYQVDGKGNPIKADATWLAGLSNGSTTIIDDYGDVFEIVKAAGSVTSIMNRSLWAVYPSDPKVNLTEEQFLDLNLKVPDEANCVRWLRTNPAIWDLNHARRRANITYELQLNNIRTTSTFYPHYYYDLGSDAVSIDVTPPAALGSVTVKHYIMNPYWFTFQGGKRIRLNDNYMFGYFENTPVGKKFNASTAKTLKTATDAASMSAYDDVDGINWSTLTYDISKANLNDVTPMDVDPLGYLKDHNQHTELHPLATEGTHYNYAPGNILLVVPQELSDEDVPHVIITAKGKRGVWNSAAKKWTEGEDLSAKVTVNMLKMGISWQSGFIYCYAFLDDLKPGDDKVRGPESITTLFNKEWYTDQW